MGCGSCASGWATGQSARPSRSPTRDRGGSSRATSTETGISTSSRGRRAAPPTRCVLLGSGGGGFHAQEELPFSATGPSVRPGSRSAASTPTPTVICMATSRGSIPGPVFETGGHARVFLGDDDGGLSSIADGPWPVGAGAAAVAVGDFDDDGRPDLLAAGSGSGRRQHGVGPAQHDAMAAGPVLGRRGRLRAAGARHDQPYVATLSVANAGQRRAARQRRRTSPARIPTTS